MFSFYDGKESKRHFQGEMKRREKERDRKRGREREREQEEVGGVNLNVSPHPHADVCGVEITESSGMRGKDGNERRETEE